MYQIYPTKKVGADIEFMAHEIGKLTINHMIKNDGIEADADGKKYVVKGSYIDADGKVSTPTYTESGVTFSTPPIGILFATVNATYADAHGAVLVKGVVKGDWLLAAQGADKAYNTQIGEKIVEALPGISVLGDDGSYVEAKPSTGSVSSTVNFDLSKATGTLGVDKGGTGATSASEALDALMESQPLSVAKGGTGKTSASEALDALLESNPLPIEKGGTNATDKDTALTNLGAQKAE